MFADTSCLLATTMSSSSEKLIPLLEGSNYLIWAGVMRPYLQSQEIWHIVNGGKLKPRALTAMATNASKVATRKAERKNWNNKDDRHHYDVLFSTFQI